MAFKLRLRDIKTIKDIVKYTPASSLYQLQLKKGTIYIYIF